MKEFSIVLCGSARVGKSCLINAMTGARMTTTSAHLDSCTQSLHKHSFTIATEDGSGPALISFWDTPGIENWSEEFVKNYIQGLVQTTQPLCLIYCASPGSMAKESVIRWFCESCTSNNIFFALVCTNKYSGNLQQQKAVVNGFLSILTDIGGKPQHKTKKDIYLCPGIGLVARVNSEVYDNGYGFQKEPEGITELCLTIMEQLEGPKLKGWCLALTNNKSFWSKALHKIGHLLQRITL